jgi:hypothetical protein
MSKAKTLTAGHEADGRLPLPPKDDGIRLWKFVAPNPVWEAAQATSFVVGGAIGGGQLDGEVTDIVAYPEGVLVRIRPTGYPDDSQERRSLLFTGAGYGIVEAP